MPRFDSAELFRDYPAVIKKMRPIFTSHEFILRLAQRNQKAYIMALQSYRDTPGPFRTLHIQLAKRLHNHRDMVRPMRMKAHPDIFNDLSRCMEWSRVGV